MATLLAPDTSPVAPRVAAYLDRVRGVCLEISGEDLKAAGVPESPAIGRALKETLALKLDGLVAGREEELGAALTLVQGDPS